jgi:hypothetical protein
MRTNVARKWRRWESVLTRAPLGIFLVRTESEILGADDAMSNLTAGFIVMVPFWACVFAVFCWIVT